MKNLKTVTIAISAHNEEKTIQKLLNSLAVQKKLNYELEKIVILCDGCTDNTPDICKVFARKNKTCKVKVFLDRKGKAKRLMSVFKKLTSDIVIVLDADVMLGNNRVIERLVNGFKSKNVGLVGGFNTPYAPRNYFESVIITWLQIWNNIRIDFNNGNSIHNSLGCVLAIKRSVANKVTYPSYIIPDDDFIYFTALKYGYKFKFSKNSIVYYRTIDNLSDFLKQHSRLYHSKKQIFAHFGEWTKSSYKVPNRLKLKHLIASLIHSPIKTTLAISLQSLVRFDYGFMNEKYREGFWSIAKSSKL